MFHQKRNQKAFGRGAFSGDFLALREKMCEAAAKAAKAAGYTNAGTVGFAG